MSTNLARASNRELQAENAGLRSLLTQAGRDAATLVTKAGLDAEASEDAKALQHLLLLELQHRLKNTLATVMAITSQSLRTAETLEQGRIAVEQRILALGRAHDLMLQANWSPSNLFDVVQTAIGPFDDHEETRFSVQDCALEIGSEVILPLVLSLNELCTNALKYGALSNSTGRIAIKWTVDEDMLRFSWTETGGPAVREPRRKGFGTRMIDRLGAQIHGTVRKKYEPDGFIYELDVHLTELKRRVA